MMNILIFAPGVLPVTAYGGTERVIWDLGEALTALGHSVWWLSPAESAFRTGTHIPYDPLKSVSDQTPECIDVIHFHTIPQEIPSKPYIVTIHGNTPFGRELDRNAVFVSQNHAQRHGSDSYVHNGLNWENYPSPDLRSAPKRFHFLGKAAWRVKNVSGAIRTAVRAGEEIDILGGDRFNIKMGIRLTFTPKAHFHGMVGGEEKFSVLRCSKGLIFPVIWNEPFGLAVTESLYCGSPVFGTPYGSLPELVVPEVGALSAERAVLSEAVRSAGSYSRMRCHEYARDLFGSSAMAKAYVSKYEEVINGRVLNSSAPALQKEEPKFLPFIG